MNTVNTHIHHDLIEACKKGDRKAQFKLYSLYSKSMYNLCTRILRDTEAAQDALQEAFISAFNKLDTFQGKSTFGAWLKRIVINKCLTQINKRKIKEEPIDSDLADHLQEPHESTGLQLEGKKIHEAIKSLPKGCRIVFTLYQLEGYDHQEISDIMDISVSTSKSQYHRAKKLLQVKLSQTPIT